MDDGSAPALHDDPRRPRRRPSALPAPLTGGATTTRTVVAIGGTALDDPENVPLTALILGLARGERVCLLPTASGDAPAQIDAFYAAYAHAEPTHLALFRRTIVDIETYLEDQDVIYVSGGNTANALAVWRVHGVDGALRRAYARGTVLCGSSAGCNCWFESSITDSFGLGLARLRDGLGILRGSVCPHYDTEELRRPVYLRETAAGMPAGYALDDATALVFADERLTDVVSATETGRVRYVVRGEERPLPAQTLSAGPATERAHEHEHPNDR